MHVILITREEPPLSLHRFRVRKQVKEMGADDIRFNEKECCQLLNERMGLNLSKIDIDLLSKRTEGWIAGLQLAALSMQGKAGNVQVIHRFSGDDKYVDDYLTEEVLKRLPEHVQIFLLKTSILPRLSGELCAAVTGEPDAYAILQMLEKTNSFVIVLDGVSEWYRYHHLFADMLVTHLRKKLHDQLPALHIAASDWFEKNDWMMEAIEHALQGKDWTRATRLIVANAPWMLKRYENLTLRRWMYCVCLAACTLGRDRTAVLCRRTNAIQQREPRRVPSGIVRASGIYRGHTEKCGAFLALYGRIRTDEAEVQSLLHRRH